MSKNLQRIYLYSQATFEQTADSDDEIVVLEIHRGAGETDSDGEGRKEAKERKQSRLRRMEGTSGDKRTNNCTDHAGELSSS